MKKDKAFVRLSEAKSTSLSEMRATNVVRTNSLGERIVAEVSKKLFN